QARAADRQHSRRNYQAMPKRRTREGIVSIELSYCLLWLMDELNQIRCKSQKPAPERKARAILPGRGGVCPMSPMCPAGLKALAHVCLDRTETRLRLSML